MIDQLSALRLFVRVARSGSFSRAAREQHITQPTASRTIAALETEIGAALFTRTTRALTLTEAGADYLERIETLLDALDQANHAVRGSGELRGVLRVGLSSSMAVRAVIPLLPSFAEAHPALRIELIINDQRQDLIVEGVDIALRFGAMADSGAVARLLVRWPRLIAAAPSYLARRGVPRSPAELARHSAILPHAGVGAGWTFRRDGQETTVRVDGQIMVTAHDGAIAAAVAGLGIVAATRLSCRLELASGALVPLLAEWEMSDVTVNAVFASGRAAKPAARALAQFLIERLPQL
ncbi:LysR family transcriptional regulator [Rugamonas sp.]|uniref:LysR family transcriptional regulator n=1 Tax=Rugamonas sp. TaxID=1926287 RepID=UPI0025D54B32|nr:LysR family transcriptional regulator [Rugamonas sp.]